MASSFFGFNVSSAGLFTAQKNLEVITHNISNANTPGYSRQQAVQESVRPDNTFDGTGMIGGGSYVSAVNRIRNEYLDVKFWGENVTAGEWDAKQSAVADIQAVFGEPSDSGFTTIMNEFFNSLQEVSKDPSSPSARSVVQQNAITLTKYFNAMSNRLEHLQASLNQNVNAQTTQINSYGEQIRKLNGQIFDYELTGHIANDLRDQRTLIIDKLSKLADISVSEVLKGKLPGGLDDKRLEISIGGKQFVSHDRRANLVLVPRETKLNVEDTEGLFDVKWEDGDNLNIRSGILKGYIDVRDGNNGQGLAPNFKGIPYYTRCLDNFVRTFAKAFNEGFTDDDGDGQISAEEDRTGHVDGYGLDPDGAGLLNPPTNLRFFTTMAPITNERLNSRDFIGDAKTRDEISAEYDKMTAKNFTIATDITSNYYSIAASDSPDEEGNIKNISKLIEVRHNAEMFAEGAPEDYMKSIITTIAIDMQQAERLQDNHKTIMNLTDTRRMSESGVSLDEEMANMVRHQQAYNASAKMVSIWAEIYEILLNKTGL
jgi:flagellar hook-associated protein 1 FlgK